MPTRVPWCHRGHVRQRGIPCSHARVDRGHLLEHSYLQERAVATETPPLWEERGLGASEPFFQDSQAWRCRPSLQFLLSPGQALETPAPSASSELSQAPHRLPYNLLPPSTPQPHSHFSCLSLAPFGAHLAETRSPPPRWFGCPMLL